MFYKMGYPEDIVSATYYNVGPYRGNEIDASQRESLITDVTEIVSKVTAPRRNYGLSLEDVREFVTSVVDECTELAEG